MIPTFHTQTNTSNKLTSTQIPTTRAASITTDVNVELPQSPKTYAEAVSQPQSPNQQPSLARRSPSPTLSVIDALVALTSDAGVEGSMHANANANPSGTSATQSSIKTHTTVATEPMLEAKKPSKKATKKTKEAVQEDNSQDQSGSYSLSHN